MKSPRDVLLVLVVTLLNGCDAVDVRGKAPVARPTLSVVQNGAASWSTTSGWSVQNEPSFRIGSTNGPPEVTFGSIVSASLSPSGRIVVADGLAKTIRLFDRTGKFVQSVGAAGEGPGEFPVQAQLSVKAVSEDTILVSAGFRRRTQLFSLSKRSVVVVPDITNAIGSIVGPNMMITISAAGGRTIFIQATAVEDMTAPPDGKIRRLMRRTIWGTAELSWSLDLGEFERGEEIKFPANPLGSARASESYGLAFLTPESPNVFTASDPLGSRACIGSSSEPRIKCYDRAGGGVEIVWKQEPQVFTAAELQSWRNRVEASLGRAGGPAPRPEAIAMLRAIRIDRSKPFFGSFYVDGDLNLWVDIPSKAPASGSTRVLSVFEQSGRYLGDVRVPGNFAIHQIGTDRILGVAKDSNDVQSIVIFEIKKGS